MRSHRRGFTLLEQVIVATLLSLVIALSASVMQPCLVDWRILQDRSEMNRNALLATERVSSELLSTTSSSVTVVQDPPAFSFMVCRTDVGSTYDPTAGTPTWDHFVAYFLDSGNRVLYRKQWPGSGGGAAVPLLPYTLPSGSPACLRPEELRLLCSTCNGTERPISPLVDTMTLSVDAQAAVLRLQMSVQTRGGVERITKQTAVHMRMP